MHLVLLGFIGLVFVTAIVDFLRRARWIDRLALFAALVLAVATNPSFSRHRIEVASSITSPHSSPGGMMRRTDHAAAAAHVTKRLKHCDLFVVSFTTLDGGLASMGLFDRVFVFGR